MKTLKLTLATLIALASLAPAFAFAAPVEADESPSVHPQLVDGYNHVPSVGALRATVLSVYAGSAYGLESYVVTVSNAEAPIEGGDLMDSRSFRLDGLFVGAAKAVYSRQIDKNTYSIAIITRGVDSETGEVKGDVKILFRVKFTAEGVANVAEMTTQKL